MKRVMLTMLYIAILAVSLMPMSAQAGVFQDLSIGVGHFVQPATDTGGTALTLRLPYGTMPRLYPILPDRAVNRLYWSLGGRYFSQGPGQQPPDGLFLTGIGVKLHELLGVSIGASHYLRNDRLTTLTYFSVDVDARLAGKVLNPDLLAKITGD